jgi:3-hydroxyisobutyrate dehydrogenase
VRTIGFVVLGRMGLPMGARLAAAGYEVTAADKCSELETAATQAGARWSATPAGAAGGDIVITMLPGPREVREAMIGSGGILAAMPATATWIDMSSNSPRASRGLAADAAARGIAVLEAPVGGGVEAAKAGTLQLFGGGDEAILERCRSVLEVISAPRHIAHVGGQGAGLRRQAAGEPAVVRPGRGHGGSTTAGEADRNKPGCTSSALNSSAASSVFIRRDLDSLLDGDYLTTFGLDRCCEELAEITALARELGMPSELARLVDGTYQRALRRYGPVDGELLAVAVLRSRPPAAPRFRMSGSP